MPGADHRLARLRTSMHSSGFVQGVEQCLSVVGEPEELADRALRPEQP
jgi:hypothetical protein